MLTSIQRYVVMLSTQALLYGIYLETLIQCIRWLIFTDEGWKSRGKINSLTQAFATIFIFLTSTANIIVTLEFMLEIFRRERWHMHDTGIVMTISELLTFISIDYVMIYRCWIVYGKSWCVISVPATFWFCLLAFSALRLCYGIQNFSGQNHLKVRTEEMAKIGFYVCNLATTIYTTIAIIYRIWYSRNSSGGNPKRLDYIMRILAESGILYTCTIVFRLAGVVLVTKNDASGVHKFISDVSDAINFPMAGITFNLILIRVYKSRAELRDSFADSRNVNGDRTLSELQFNNSRITSSAERPSYTVPDETTNENQEHRRVRSSEGMDEASLK